MSIIISEVRLRNFKCYHKIDITLKNSNLILGSNNAGKTTFLEAIDLCFSPFKRVDDTFIHIKKGEKLDNNKKAIIDLKIQPDNDRADFEEIWYEHFGQYIVAGEEFDYVPIRCLISFNEEKDEYEVDRKILKTWPESDESYDYDAYKTNMITRTFLDSFQVFYLDAKRDIVADMNDKYSYWGRMVKDIKIDKKIEKEIEEYLGDVNEKIIDNSAVLEHLISTLASMVFQTNQKENIEINPISRKIKDLNKGMEIKVSDNNSESFSIENLGMGTRSWGTFLTLRAYIEWKNEEALDGDYPYYPIILLEEPEAHLHPQAQRTIYNQMVDLEGQVIISTHSPYIAAQADVRDFMHVYKKSDYSVIHRINTDELEKEDIRKIERMILNTRGDILFSNVLILCEGETEEQVLPDLFKFYFNKNSFELGVNIVSVSGATNYKPFLRVAKDLNIPCFIFSDGENLTIDRVSKTVKEIHNEDSIDEIVTFIPNEGNFEDMLFNEGFKDSLIELISEIKGDKAIENKIWELENKKPKPKRTDEKCVTCGQNIFEIPENSTSITEEEAISKILSGMKTEYSSMIGKKIIEKGVLPATIKSFFELIENNTNNNINREVS